MIGKWISNEIVVTVSRPACGIIRKRNHKNPQKFQKRNSLSLSLSLSLSVVGYHFYTHLMMQHQLIDNMCNILSPQKEADSKKKKTPKNRKNKNPNNGHT